VVAGPVERLCLYSRPAPDKNDRVRVVISPQDRFGNPTRFAQPLELNLAFDGTGQCVSVESTTEVSLSVNSETTRPTARLKMQDLAPSENITNGVIEGGDFVVTGTPVDATFPHSLRPAFGEFHWHTEISGDGQRPIREALRCARDELNLDFAAPGDHNTREKDWEDTVAALDEFEAPDAFATFFGWEASSPQGHENFYFTDPEHPMLCGGSAGITGGKPHENLERLRKHKDFLAIPHHTNAIAETRRLTDDAPYWHPYSWTDPTDAHRLVEIFQTRGNQERNDYTDAWRGWHQNHGASVQDALAKGYRVGFTGGTDNHCVSLYPTPPERVNMARMDWLRTFTPSVGFSDHTLGTEAAKLAIARGADFVEKHFTLSRDLPGRDQAVSAEPDEIKDIADHAQAVAERMGTAHPGLTDTERELRGRYIGKWGDNR
jgi:hypothetical protein